MPINFHSHRTECLCYSSMPILSLFCFIADIEKMDCGQNDKQSGGDGPSEREGTPSIETQIKESFHLFGRVFI